MKNVSKGLLVVTMLFAILSQSNAQQKDSSTAATTKKKWYDNFSIRGYVQTRFNRLLETNPKLKCESCDRSWGDNGGFFLRRIRIIFSGQIGERVFFYLQPDFAGSVSSSALNFGQLRDAYVDVGLDDKNEFRIRIGQSKIPFGFENMQSSQNRLPLDRADATNSAVPNERDLGVMFYWAPAAKRKLFADMISEGLKGSGDYGCFGVGVYNGQGINRPEQNNEQHYVARFTWPFAIGNQIVEGSIQGYTGQYIVTADQTSSAIKIKKDRSYLDQRVAVSAVLYPKPFGVLAEYNVGSSPQYNKLTDSIEERSLNGGFITLSYMHKTKTQVFTPYVRLQYFDGGKKTELDARSYKVYETEMGLEWQVNKNFELVTAYTISDRQFEDFALKNNRQAGNLLRIQAQLNF
jgi:hypothetical protein